MHDALVKMKDGREFCGPMWSFMAMDGYMTIPSECPDNLYFRDMESALLLGGRETAATTGHNVDLLALARKQGWKGA